MRTPSRSAVGIWLVLVAGTACGPELRRFPLAPPLWEDPDRNPVPRKPRTRFVGLLADGLDKALLWPLARLAALRSPREARNVNALDEVPNSSWFHNRLGQHPLTPAQVARGPCRWPPLDPARGPWRITKAKTEGANPGFFIKTPQGRYLLKFDGTQAPPRLTAAEVVGSRIWWAAGYHVPCNQVVLFPESVLEIGKRARTQDAVGRKRPMTRAQVDQVLSKAYRPRPGRIRAVASRLLRGQPLGPFRYESTRPDDPNDVIPHEDRRELRAMRLLSAWIHHVDSRQQNTLDMWVSRGGRRYVKHHVLDWGDSLGSRWPDDDLTRRMGHSYFIDPWHMLGDFLSLGLVARPWDRARVDPRARVFGYFRAEGFTASRWKPSYPNPAFRRMTVRDALWMVRIISRFSDAHVRAIVQQTRLGHRPLREHLTRVLIARRDRILREYLGRHAPLSRIRLQPRTGRGSGRPGGSGQRICFEHLGITQGVVSPRWVQYRVRLMAGRRLRRRLGWHQLRPDPARPGHSCVAVLRGGRRPATLAPTGAADDHPLRYAVLEIQVLQGSALEVSSVVEAHLYDLGPRRGLRLVGLHRRLGGPGNAPRSRTGAPLRIPMP